MLILRIIDFALFVIFIFSDNKFDISMKHEVIACIEN